MQGEVFIADGTKPLLFDIQDDLLTVWYESNAKAYLNYAHDFVVIGTGQQIPNGPGWRHLGSTIDHATGFDWHCYYNKQV